MADAKWFLLLVECKWRLAFTVVRREFRVTVVSFTSVSFFFLQLHGSFTQEEHCSIIVMCPSKIQSHFKAALIDREAPDYFLLSPGYKEYSITVQHRPLPRNWQGPHPLLSSGCFLEQAGIHPFLVALGKLFTWVFALQSLCVASSAQWSFVVTEKKTCGIDSYQILNLSIHQCSQLNMKPTIPA